MTSEEFVERFVEGPSGLGLHRSFIEHWYGELGPGSGSSPVALASTEERLGRKLPAALREWYGLIGERDDLVRQQDHLLALEALKLEHGRLVFHVENQSTCKWFIQEAALEEADPPVLVDLEPWPSGAPSGHLALAAPTVSQFCLHMLVQEAVMSGLAQRRLLLGPAPGVRERVHAESIDLGLPHWHFPAYPRILLAAPGPMELLIDSIGPPPIAELWVAARTGEALQRFLASFPAPWESTMDPTHTLIEFT